MFKGRNIDHLTRSGAKSKLEVVVRKAASKHPKLLRKSISPRVLRHSTAMAMLQSRIDLSTITIWLGHEHIQTTHKYVVADMVLKESAIEKVHIGRPEAKKGRHQSSPGILGFLESI